MPPAVDDDFDTAERRIRRLEHRYRRAQSAAAAAKALYGALHETPGATTTQLHHAARAVEEAQRYLVDIQAALERAEDQNAVA